MTKEEAAENIANKLLNGRADTRLFGYIEEGAIAGWEACEAQSPTDAVALLQEAQKALIQISGAEAWIYDIHIKGLWPKFVYPIFEKIDSFLKEIEQNPSGAAPQTIKLPDEFYNCLPKGYEFVNEAPLVSNHYDAEENEIEGECVIVMIMKGKEDISVLTPTQILPYGMLNAVYEGAGEWEDRCRSAEDALKALVNMKQWKERSGKDEIYIRQQPLAWAEANNHLATYYEEYEKTPAARAEGWAVGDRAMDNMLRDQGSLKPAPQAAGPVWVKGVPKLPGYYHLSADDKESYEYVNPTAIELGYWNRMNYRYLDEANTQQLFTRDEVENILNDYASDRPERQSPFAWFNNKYPIK